MLQAKEEKLHAWEERVYLVIFRGSCLLKWFLDTFGEKWIFRGLRDWLHLFTGLSRHKTPFRIFRFFNGDESAWSRIKNPILDFIKETHPQWRPLRHNRFRNSAWAAREQWPVQQFVKLASSCCAKVFLEKKAGAEYFIYSSRAGVGKTPTRGRGRGRGRGH